jgi:uncharacterized membrane protein
LIAVFPANAHMAMHHEEYQWASSVILWLRLPLQGFLILWAYWHTGTDRSTENVRQQGSLHE